MPSEPRISTELVEHVSDIRYAWAKAMADGVITVEEAAEMSRSLETLETKGAELDLGVAITIAYLRRGPESVRAHRLNNDLLKFQATNVSPDAA